MPTTVKKELIEQAANLLRLEDNINGDLCGIGSNDWDKIWKTAVMNAISV